MIYLTSLLRVLYLFNDKKTEDSSSNINYTVNSVKLIFQSFNEGQIYLLYILIHLF